MIVEQRLEKAIGPILCAIRHVLNTLRSIVVVCLDLFSRWIASCEIIATNIKFDNLYCNCIFTILDNTVQSATSAKKTENFCQNAFSIEPAQETCNTWLKRVPSTFVPSLLFGINICNWRW